MEVNYCLASELVVKQGMTDIVYVLKFALAQVRFNTEKLPLPHRSKKMHEEEGLYTFYLGTMHMCKKLSG